MCKPYIFTAAEAVDFVLSRSQGSQDFQAPTCFPLILFSVMKSHHAPVARSWLANVCSEIENDKNAFKVNYSKHNIKRTAGIYSMWRLVILVFLEQFCNLSTTHMM